MSERVSQEKPTVIKQGKPKFNLNIKSRKVEASIPIESPKQKKNGLEKIKEGKRKASGDIKGLNCISIFRDKSINEGFEDLFQIGEKLGEGVQSEVFKCIERSSGKAYAVKVCKRH